MPALLYGTFAEVRKRCRKALVRILRDRQPLLDTFESVGMIATVDHPGLLVLEGPGPLVSKYVHFHCYVPLRLLIPGTEQSLGPIDPETEEAIFSAMLEKPWSMLCMMSNNNMAFWFKGIPDRYRRYLRAVLRHWDLLDAEGARYSWASSAGEHLWEVALPVGHALASLGVPREMLVGYGVPPLPPGGLGALLAHADRSLAGDLVDLGAAEAARREHTASAQHPARPALTDGVPDLGGVAFMSERMKAALQANDEGAVRRLVAAGEPVDAADMEGEWTPLLWAAHQGRTDLVRFLLDHGANIEDRWVEGESPLMLAAMNGHRDTVQLLLDRGAHPNYVTDKGWDVVQFAEMSGDPELITVLERACQARVRRNQRRH